MADAKISALTDGVTAVAGDKIPVSRSGANVSLTLGGGTATLDFGATPASEATVVVTGQTGILDTTHIRPAISSIATVDNDANGHLMAQIFLRLAISAIIDGTGFTITATSIAGLASGTFRAEYNWSA